MFRIGFSNKFFTLWKVEEFDKWQSVGILEFQVKTKENTFIKNLSFDEFTAKRKSIFEGVENYKVDLLLCGEKHAKNQYEKKDSDELFFMYYETRNEIIKTILLQRGFVNYKNQIIYPEHYRRILTQQKLEIMTNKEEILEITLKIAELKGERDALKDVRLDECEFKIGENVNVYHGIKYRYKEDENEVEFIGRGFVKKIYVNDEGDFEYDLKREKKDGTESCMGFGYYGYLTVEKIK